MNTFLSAAITLTFIGVFLILGLDTIDRVERHECLVWRKQAEDLRDYSITQWQADQCNYQNVYIPAPVE